MDSEVGRTGCGYESQIVRDGRVVGERIDDHTGVRPWSASEVGFKDAILRGDSWAWRVRLNDNPSLDYRDPESSEQAETCRTFVPRHLPFSTPSGS